jgi:hypothetical protein
MVSGTGVLDAAVHLTIDAERRWTLRMLNAVASGTSHRIGTNEHALDGFVIDGDPSTVGRALWFLLVPRGSDALYGHGQVFYLGHRIGVVVTLRRVGS